MTPQAATDRASARTGRAFFTSALTTIFGFGVLMFSALPLLSDFGLIVTMNIAVALLSSLIVMPPLLVWADGRGYIGASVVASEESAHGVKLADKTRPSFIVAVIAVLALAFTLFLSADADEGSATTVEFSAVALPTTTTTTVAPDPEEEPEVIDVSRFGSEQPTGLIDGTLWLFLTQAGADPQRAVCARSILLKRVSEDQLIELGLVEFSDASLVPVIEAGLDCGLDQTTIDAAVVIARGG